MKIILLYTPRSGSSSILRYFSKVKPEYECLADPWFWWMTERVYDRTFTYDEIISKENIFIKCTYKLLPTSIEQITKDFDKVIFLLRKNTQEQVESDLFAHRNERFTSTDKQKYFLGDIDDIEFDTNTERFNFLNETLSSAAKQYNKPLFYYEDLYHRDFTPLFNELEIGYDPQYFSEYLDISKRYREGTLESKNVKSII